MKLISVGAVTPQGATLKEHILNGSAALNAQNTSIEYLIHGVKRKVAVHRAVEPTVSLPVPDGVLRRMGLSTKLALSSIEEAKTNAAFNLDGKKVGLIVATTQGPSSTNIEYFRKLVSFNYRGASPNLFAQSVHNNIASTIALTHKWQGPTLTLVQEDNLWSALMKIAQLWLNQKVVDNLWIIIGNEVSLHVPYIQLFEYLQSNPDALEFRTPERDKAYEAYSCFLLGREEAAPKTAPAFNLENTTALLKRFEEEQDRPLVKPELIGVSLAEYFYREHFAK